MDGDFNRVTQTPIQQIRGLSGLVHRWSSPPPPCAYKKINWDTALDPVRKRTRIGVVIRDEIGGFFAA
jgi:hypothetical protein